MGNVVPPVTAIDGGASLLGAKVDGVDEVELPLVMLPPPPPPLPPPPPVMAVVSVDSPEVESMRALILDTEESRILPSYELMSS